MLTIACILRSGGCYDARYVAALLKGVDRHLKSEFKFICLTDMKEEVDGAVTAIKPRHDGLLYGSAPFIHPFPGWFAKLNGLELPGPVLMIDLDTVIVGDVTPLAEIVCGLGDHDLLGINDFYRPHLWQTGILGWTEMMDGITDRFDVLTRGALWKKTQSHDFVHLDGGARIDGDADWVGPLALKEGRNLLRAQNLFPGIYSYKAHVCKLGHVPDDATMICFHGRPRPHELAEHDMPEWMRESWSNV
jgi:hypothetical protein